MGSIILNKVSTIEQGSYDWAFVPPRNNVNVILSNWSIGHYPNFMEGIKHITSTTQGGYIHFRFRGRRIGILIAKTLGNGMLNFDVDGTYYGQYDTSFVDDYNTSSTLYNIPVVIATDLPDGEHVLTITKPDNKNTSVQGFLVDTAGGAQSFVRSIINYHEMMDTASGAPVSVGTTDTTVKSGADFILFNATLTNTTASAINVTIKNNAGTAVIGPFPVAANDIRQITGQLYFAGGVKAVASATGITIVVGGQ